jgi:hypothetical protein
VVTLQVDDQVPFSTGTATVLTANTVVSTIDYKRVGRLGLHAGDVVSVHRNKCASI